MSYDLTYLAFGAGVQSTALLVCSNLGLLGVPRADLAVFADTQSEPPWVMETFRKLREWSEIPVVSVTHGSVFDDALASRPTTRAGAKRKVRRGTTIPMYTLSDSGSEGMIRRKCTKDYKVTPMVQHIRSLVDRKAKGRARAMLGISVDEAHRMKPSGYSWIDNIYPLVDARLNRSACVKIVEAHLGFVPKRSACFICPFKSTQEWISLYREDPVLFAKAEEFERSFQATSDADLHKAFLNNRRVPLGELIQIAERPSLFDEQPDQFGNECFGVCGV